nr:PASTA domain-containing protein [Pedobacter sp. ASV12]
MRDVVNYDGIFGYFRINRGLTDVGKVGTVPDLQGKSLGEADKALKDAGFEGGEPTKPGNQEDKDGKKNKGGYRTYKNEDGSEVTIKPDGTVVRSTKPRYDPIDGSRVNRGEKLIKTEDGFQATRDQKIIHDNRTIHPEQIKIQ